jgi:hypothetical protein
LALDEDADIETIVDVDEQLEQKEKAPFNQRDK